jgi:acyl carrier protein
VSWRDRLRRRPREAGAPAAAGSAAETPERASVLEQLCAFVALQSDGEVTADAVPTHARIYDDGVIDSIGAAAMLAFVEDRYDVEVDEVELVGRLATLAALAEHVCRELERR